MAAMGERRPPTTRMEHDMAAITPDVSRGTATTIPAWAPVAMVLAVALLWLVTFESGEVMNLLGRASLLLHETFHDGRHLLGVPCH